MINMLLQQLSFKHNIFYLEKRSYKEGKIYKSYVVKIDKISTEFKNERDLLIYLKEMI